MLQALLMVAVGLMFCSCAAGGGAVSMGASRWQGYWWDVGLDRYEPVVYPAGPVAGP